MSQLVQLALLITVLLTILEYISISMRYGSIFKASALCASALALIGCGSLIPPASPHSPGVSRSQSSTASTSAPAVRTAPRRVASLPQQPISRASDRACFAELSETGARFTPVPDTYGAPGCNKLGTVQLTALAGDRSQFSMSNVGPLQCPVAQAFSAWARFGVDRAAQQILGSPLARIETMGTYSCRNIAGTNRRSSHARAAAIDVSGFVLADGRRITLVEDWDGGTPAEREFLRVVHRSACKRFGTVLGPEYDAAHADHFHLEGSDPSYCR
ncbi:MAG: extensin family protein [Pseudomonadota bacterium]